MSDLSFLENAQRRASEKKDSIDARRRSDAKQDTRAKPVQDTGDTRVEPVQSEDDVNGRLVVDSASQAGVPKVRRSSKKVRLELTVSKDVREELRRASVETGISISSLLVMGWNMSKHDVWR